MKKNVFSILLIISALLLPASLTANGQQDTAGSEDQSPVEFDFWTTQTQSDRLATIQVLIDTYTTLYPDVTINLVPVDENDMVSNVQTAAMSGSLPAMIEGSADMHVSFGAEGIVDTAATTDLIEKVGKSDFYAGPLKMLESADGGNYYGVPYHGWIQGIWYRADWFEKAGLEPPVTWDNILKAAEYFYKPADNQYGILVGTTAETYSEQCFTPFAMSNNAGLFDKEGNLVFNSPEMKEAVEYYAELAKYNPPGPQTWRARDYYLQGKMAMFFYSTYIMDDLALAEVAQGSLTSENFENLKGASFDPDLVKNTRMASVVSNKSDAGYGTVVAFSFLNQDDKRITEAASKFVEYLFTPNAYITWLHMAPGGMNPMLRGIAENARFQNDPKGIFKNYGPEKMAEIIDGLNNIESFGIVEGNVIEAASSVTAQQIIPKMIYSITQEGTSVDAAMSKAESEMEKLLQ